MDHRFYPTKATRRGVFVILGWVIPCAILTGAAVYSQYQTQAWRARVNAKQEALDTLERKIQDTQKELDSKRLELQDVDKLNEALEDVRDAANHVFIMLDTEGRVIVWNKGAERVTGWTQEEMMGQTLERLMPAEIYPQHRDALIARISDKSQWRKVSRVQCELIYKDDAKPRRDWIITVRVVQSVRHPDRPSMMALLDKPENVTTLQVR